MVKYYITRECVIYRRRCEGAVSVTARLVCFNDEVPYSSAELIPVTKSPWYLGKLLWYLEILEVGVVNCPFYLFVCLFEGVLMQDF